MDHSSIQPLNPVFFQISDLSIQWYAIAILGGTFIATLLSIREGSKFGLKSEFFQDLVLYGFPLSIVGARLYYVIFNWGFYSRNPDQIIQIQNGGLAIHGAILTVIAYGFFMAKRQKMQAWLLFDICAPGFIMAQAIGRWGNFMNQEAHGGVVPGGSLDAQRQFLEGMFLPRFVVDNMFIGGEYVHPTFLYESLWNLLGFLIMALILRKLASILVGEIGAFYVIWYSIGRFFIEGMRTDSLMLFGLVPMAQLISIAGIVLPLVFLIGRRIKKQNLKTYRGFYGTLGGKA